MSGSGRNDPAARGRTVEQTIVRAACEAEDGGPAMTSRRERRGPRGLAGRLKGYFSCSSCRARRRGHRGAGLRAYSATRHDLGELRHFTPALRSPARRRGTDRVPRRRQDLMESCEACLSHPILATGRRSVIGPAHTRAVQLIRGGVDVSLHLSSRGTCAGGGGRLAALLGFGFAAHRAMIGRWNDYWSVVFLTLGTSSLGRPEPVSCRTLWRRYSTRSCT